MAAQAIGSLFVSLGLDSAAFQTGIAKAKSTMASLGRDMQGVGRSMSLGVTTPLVALGGLSLHAAGNFEASMKRVGAALSGISTAELDALSKAAKDMGRETQFSATQSADAIEVLAKNGLDASQILGGALSASMLLAASSGTDLSSAGDIATDVMLQFGKQAGELTGLVDGITGTLLVSKFGIDDYRLALGQAGGVAGGIGVDFEDFNAAIAATSSLFASGSDAGTSYKSFLQRLVPASGPAAEKIRELNLEFFDAQGNMRSMAEIAETLKVGMADLSDEARNDALSTIFGTDAMRAAIGLMNQGADGINRVRTEISKASATEQAAARMEGLNGAVVQLRSAFEALQIAIAEAGLIQLATDGVKWLTQLIGKMSETNPAFLRFAVVLAASAAALGPVLIGLGTLMALAGPIAAVVAAIVSPFALLAAGVAAAAVAIYANWDGIAPWLRGIGDNIARVMRGIGDVISGLFTGDMPRLISGFREVWDGLSSYWSLLWDGITAVLTAAWEKIVVPLTDWLGITDDIKAAWETVSSTISSALDSVVGAFDAAWARIEPILSSLKSGWDRLTASRDGPISSGPYTGGATGPALPGTTSTDMINGVKVGTGAAGKAGAEDAAAYERGWRDRMGIKSPSRVMAEIGGYLTDGLGVGIEGGVPRVTQAMEQVAAAVDGREGSVSDSFRSFASSAQSAFQSVITGSMKVKDALKQVAAEWLSSMASGLFTSGFGAVMGGLGIPGFANGVSNFRGGVAQVNERGGEILRLPSGTDVIPAGLSQRIADRMSGGAQALAVTITMDESTGALGAFVRDQAGAVVAMAAPSIQREAVVQTIAANRRSKSFLR